MVKRINQHKQKQSFFTKKFLQIKLIYCEKYPNEKIAVAREKQLKGWSRPKKQLLINGKLGINACTESAEALLTG